ncbi:MAG TPA: tRNA (adenosine(37)-N6)-dimethylallyltransferase MiaA [Candidatus Angelobacter sp.]|nr:tRNA (adenosine(37)-N6)-dimethylallyltransferase MiaA [Candidatus Angelobacter sp.]HKT52067.1 tRNA (adenosine(37)-N6)-dimethylallyltransferase MiaA [Candidatus Angelobacter sp.]
MREPLLVILLGPTASGKTALSLWLAQRLKGEIVSCDSVAVYQEFEIGTAKPSAEERRLVPHHLIDIAPPDGLLTAGDYARMAREALSEISARGKLPIVVGGTGLYLKALLEGLFAGPPRSEDLRARLRQRVETRGAEYLHRILKRLDPRAAASIHANDVPKVIRAIEVCINARQRMTEMWQAGRDPLRGFRIFRIGLDPDRDLLYQRINQRAQEMFQHGLVEETRVLRERYGSSARSLGSLGYKQAAQLLAGELSREQAVAAAQQGHRNYAKRQMTWFRRERDVHWLRGFGSDQQVKQDALSLISAVSQ